MTRILAFYMALLPIALIAQTNNKVAPPTFKDKIAAVSNVFIAPTVDNFTAQTEANTLQESTLDKVKRFGKELEVNLDFKANAQIDVLPNGDKLYRLGLKSKGAFSINLLLSDFELNGDALLFLTDPIHKVHFGAYTKANNSAAKALGTDLIHTDFAELVLVEPANSPSSNFTIQTFVHGFADLRVMSKGLNTSGDCHLDVNCPAGDDWKQQRNSVGMMLNGGGFCTGSLVNTTSNTLMPYFITARHCGTNPTNWVFRFRWESPEGQADCATTGDSENGPTNMNVNGATLISQNSNSDFSLVEMNAFPDPNWSIYYNGWDNSDNNDVNQGVSIHHPDGDIKKISADYDKLDQSVITFQNAQNRVWKINDWDLGVTEPGSSGSPLFNGNKKLIGVLSGGFAACSGTDDNNEPDYYGRIGYGWDNDPNASKRLRDWLDPENTGVNVIDGVDPLIGKDTLDAALTLQSNFENAFCQDPVVANIVLSNSGIDTLIKVDFEYGFDGNLNQTYTWTGSLASYENEIVDFSFVSFPSGTHEFNVAVLATNDEPDLDSLNDIINKTYTTMNPETSLHVELGLDCFATETSWTLTDSAGTVLYRGGSYEDNQPITISEDLCLQYGCYTFTLYDEYGDGLSTCDAGSGGEGELELTLENTTHNLGFVSGDFGFEYESSFCIDSLTSINEIDLDTRLSLYPNPGNEEFKIQASKIKITYVKVYNIQGKVIQEIDGNNLDILTVNTASLPKGVYLISILTSNGTATKRWIKQ
jgi:lysyl endopeptidase